MNFLPPNGWIRFSFARGHYTCYMGWNSRMHLSQGKSILIRLMVFFLLTEFVSYGTFGAMPKQSGLIALALTVLSLIASGFILWIGGEHIVLWKTLFAIPYRRVVVRLDTPERIKIGFHWNRPDSNWIGIRERMELTQIGQKDHYTARDPRVLFGSPVTLTTMGNLIKEDIARHLEKRNKKIPQTTHQLLAALRSSQNYSTIEQILKNGASAKLGHFFGRTPLHYAAQFYETAEVAKLLVNSACPINTTDDFGETALALAIRSGRLETAKFLIERGAVCHTRNGYGLNLLHLVAQAPKGVKPLIPILLSKGISVSEEDQLGNLPIHYAAGWVGEGSTEALSTLLKAKTNINAKNHLGRTPLHFAAKSALNENLKILISCGANPIIRDHDGNLASDISSIHALHTRQTAEPKVA